MLGFKTTALQAERFEYLQYVAKKITEIGNAECFIILNAFSGNKVLSIQTLLRKTQLDPKAVNHHLSKLIETNFIVKTADKTAEYYTLRDPQLLRLLNSIRKSNYFLS